MYIVLAHQDWPQVRRLAGAILSSSPAARVIIAADARTERFPRDAGDPRIDIFEHGRASDWGSWELVEATLDAMAHARAQHDPALVCLVSGSDYPVRPLVDWETEALAADGWIGSAAPLRYRPRWGRRRGEGDDRWTRYAYRWFRAPFPGAAIHKRPWAERVRGAIALRLEPAVGVRVVSRGRGLHFGVRRVPPPFTESSPCWFGSQWLAVRRTQLDHLLDEDFAPRSRLRRIYRRAVIPDESALVTALAWRARPSPLPPVTAVHWEDALDQPRTRTLDDLEVLVESGSPFCRKVDPRLSSTLLDALDRLTAAAE